MLKILWVLLIHRCTKIMATIRAYTTIEQSRKLAKILPIDSADMWWNGFVDEEHSVIWDGYPNFLSSDICTPCWSLAALLGVLPNYQMQTQDDGIGILCSCNGKFNIVTADNPVDACVAMIEKLHELNLL